MPEQRFRGVNFTVLLHSEMGFAEKAGASSSASDASAFDFDSTLRWCSDLAQNLQQRRLARTITPDDAKDFAFFDLQIDVPQRPEFIPVLEALVVLMANRCIRVLLATELGPAALQVFIKHVAVDHPEAIPLAEIFNFDDGGHWKDGG
jgi:hypothetical protein